MSDKPSNVEDIKKMAVDLFGEDMVLTLDVLFLEFQDLRITCPDNFVFFQKVKERYNSHGDHLIAALLYGMKLGELGLMYHLKQVEEQQVCELPFYG